MIKKIRKMTFGAGLFFDILGSELYESAAACLMELIRNGVVACMPGGKWIPGRGRVEITLVPNHPLAPKSTALVILDRGRGFTDPDWDQYCTVGPSVADLKNGGGSHGGAAMKRIGRFAALALNKKCSKDRDPNSGFYCLTRTSSQGPVKFIIMIPARLQDDGGPTEEEITPDSIELGSLRGIKGSFTAIVIPNPVFSNYEEIREGLQWLIPRKPDQMFELVIGGKLLAPPPLASAVNFASSDGEIEVHVGKAKNSKDQSEGIWFTDAKTGIRVAFAPRLAARSGLGYPIWSPALVGDIFIPDLLAHQDTARGTLHGKYLKSDAWKRRVLWLNGNALQKLQPLLGNEDTFSATKLGKVIGSLKALFDEAFGAADSKGPVVLFPDGGNGSGPHRPHHPNPNPIHRTPRTPGPDGPNPPKPRVFPLKFGDETYYLVPRQLDSLVFADVDDANGRVLYVNNRVYEAMPRTSEAAEEHALLKLLEAVGQFKHPDGPQAVRQYVAEMRQRLLKPRR